MCRTVHSILGTIICGLQMLVRVMMTIILMMENLIRMFLQTFYNFVSFMLQMISLVPICLVFLLTSRLKCFMCGGGGPCPVNRGGTCDCLMSAVAIIILFFIFRATGLLDKIFYKIGYAKATPEPFTRFVPTPGDITECSRDSNETDEDYDSSTQSTLTISNPTITNPTESKSAASKSGASKSGATKSGATKSDATKSDATKSGATKSGATKSSASKSGTSKSAASKSSKSTTLSSNIPTAVLREIVDSEPEFESETTDEGDETPEPETELNSTPATTTLPLTLPSTPPELSILDNTWTTIIYYIE